MRSLSILVVVVAACGGASPTPHAPPARPVPAAPAVLVVPTAHGKGKVETKRFHSKALGVDKDYVVYLPGGYGDDPSARWPVLYYLHGLTGDETNWTRLGDLAGAADEIELPAIVVMPDGDDGFYANSVTPRNYDACMKDGAGLFDPSQDRAKQCVRAARYEDYIVDDLIGHVDATYATIADRRARGIAGASMGGFGAWSLALRHPDRFSAAASHSGVIALFYQGPHPYQAGKAQLVADVASWGKTVEPIGGWVRAIFGPDRASWEAHDPATLVQKLAPGTLALYLDAGTEDIFGLDAEAAYVHDLLVARGIDHTYYVGPGRHDFDFWHERVKHSLRFFRAHLLGKDLPAEEPPPVAAPPAVALVTTIAGEGVADDLAEHLSEGVIEAARQCVAKTHPPDGVREVAFGVTDHADLADLKWLGDAPHDAFAECLAPPPPASAGTVRYVYVAFQIGAAPTALTRPDRAADLASLCASKLELVRHPDVLAVAHAMAVADAKQKRALVTKTCPRARAR